MAAWIARCKSPRLRLGFHNIQLTCLGRFISAQFFAAQISLIGRKANTRLPLQKTSLSGMVVSRSLRNEQVGNTPSPLRHSMFGGMKYARDRLAGSNFTSRTLARRCHLRLRH